MLRIEGGKEGNDRCAPVFMNKSNGTRLMMVWVFFFVISTFSQTEASWAFPSQSLDEPESWQFSKGNMPNVTELY